jgi:hypothetical protein
VKQVKPQFRSTGAKLPGSPDKVRAAEEIASDLHLDPVQSGKAKRGKAKDQLKALASA